MRLAVLVAVLAIAAGALLPPLASCTATAAAASRARVDTPRQWAETGGGEGGEATAARLLEWVRGQAGGGAEEWAHGADRLVHSTREGSARVEDSGSARVEGSSPRVGYFLRSLKEVNESAQSLVLARNDTHALHKLSWLEGVRWYRLLPATFPEQMHYHFDGLAQVLAMDFASGGAAGDMHASYFSKDFSDAARDKWRRCLFLGVGTGPTAGVRPCAKNPAVNLLPIGGQLWLTIDTVLWGRVDPISLETLPGVVRARTLTLNAHPSHDYESGATFVQHPCPADLFPLSPEVCVSVLEPQPGADSSMAAAEVSRANATRPLLIQHSHSPCLSRTRFVAKLDEFEAAQAPNTNADNHGMLRWLQQAEGSEWLVMDRLTNRSSIYHSNVSFVNNHFWNCYDSHEGVVVDTVAATSSYLYSYFAYMLQDPPRWSDIFEPPQRCVVPPPPASRIACSPLMRDPTVIFDYPTYNPLWKTRPDYRFFYAISPRSDASLWFDRAIKVDEKSGEVLAEWSRPDTFLTELDFVPNPQQPAPEDDGVLLAVLYDDARDESSVGVFDAADLSLIASLPMQHVVPFHAHGIVCVPRPSSPAGLMCYSNP
eukprot:TRINITY_DN5907_c0_g1_i1.p1 TRINITY_DN5907_c0_g1~~TRINITY_DN5907_c0_g1_i1.p1  ORF type:complete len:625 (-),score=226.74 TRINITY_DN5907_c0_g1_i1:225-2018(-)